MTLREKLMHYTYDLDCCSNLKQEAITTIEDIAQYMDEDELLHHSRPLAIAYLALTEDVSAPVRHGRWINAYPNIEPNPMFMYGICSECGFEQGISKYLNYCPNCGAKMD